MDMDVADGIVDDVVPENTIKPAVSHVSFSGSGRSLNDSAFGNSRYVSTSSDWSSESQGLGADIGTYGSVASRSSVFTMEGEYSYREYDEERISSMLQKQNEVFSDPEIHSHHSHAYPTIPELYEESDTYYDSDSDDTVVLSTEQLATARGSRNGYGSAYVNSAPSDSEYFSTGYRPGRRHTPSGYHPVRAPRRPLGKVSTILVAWNVLNLLLNLSILAIPFSIAFGGIVAVGLIPLVSLITGYTGKIIIDCMYVRLPKKANVKARVRLDYVELGQDFTNSKTGGQVIQFLQVTEMFTLCILNINVLGELCHEILKNHLDIHICTLVGAAFAMPTFFVRKISIIAWMQLVGIVSLAIGLILIEVYCVGNVGNWSISNIPLYDLEHLPISAGIIIFAYGIHPVLPGIEQQMRKPTQYHRMLIFTFLIALIVNGFFGVSNTLLYGKRTAEVITVDLESHLGLGISSSVFIFLSVLCLFALPTFVVMEGIDAAVADYFPIFKKRESGYNIWLSFIVRFVVTGVSMVVAMFVPHFALLMGLIGSSVTTFLSLIIPCVFHLKLKRDIFRWYHWVLDIGIIIFGFFMFGTGVFFSAKAMVGNV